MPRKAESKTGNHLKYIPAGKLQILEQLAENFPYIGDKHIAFCKYVEAVSSIIERSWNRESKTVAVSERILAKKLSIASTGAARILSDLLKHNIIVQDKANFKFAKHSWEYGVAAEHDDVVLISINRKFLNKKSDAMLAPYNSDNLSADVNSYKKILSKLRFHDDVYGYMNNILSSNHNNTINDIKELLMPLYCNSFVPYADVSSTSNGAEGNSFVPQAFSANAEGNSSVPYSVVGKIPAEFRSVIKIMRQEFTASRPVANSRVYTNITNLKRDYRKYLRLNGKPLLGFDIANSQPMIAAVAFRRYSENTYDEIMPDVLQYQQDCEAGRFYEYFMQLNGIDTTDDAVRTEFKGTFFGSVFYTMCVLLAESCKCKAECSCSEKKKLKARLIKQFKECYPTCYDAIFTLKGGLFSKQYKDFPAIMTEIETAIMFETNIELINEGYDVLNIFDSLYSDSEQAIERAKELVLEKFTALGITPTLKDINYNEIPALPAKKTLNTTKHITLQPNPYKTVRNQPQEQKKDVATPAQGKLISFPQFQQQYHKEHYPFIPSMHQLRQEYNQLLKTQAL